MEFHEIDCVGKIFVQRLSVKPSDSASNEGRIIYTQDSDTVYYGKASVWEELCNLTGTQTLSNKTLTSPLLVTPTLGVATATSINGLTITSSTGTLTITNGKTLSISNTLVFTGTDSSTVAFGTGGTVAYTANKLSAFASTTSAELAGVISNETGSGALVFATSPTLVTPILGDAVANTVNGLTITSSTGTLTITNSKVVSFSNTLTFTGTDSSSVAFGTGGTVTYTSNKLNVFASTTSAELAGIISNETGTGSLVFATSPTLTTPYISDFTNANHNHISAATGGYVRSISINLFVSNHGLVTGDVVRYDSVLGYTKASSSAAATADDVVGIATRIDEHNFTLHMAGYVTGLSSLVSGTIYYLSSAGILTATEPTSGVIKPILLATSATIGYLINHIDLYKTVSVGSIMMHGVSTVPSGFLKCDGSAVSRTTYANLFTVIGTAFGSGNGSTTFNVPNLQYKFALGANDSTVLVGATGGEATHVLTTDEIPSHTHTSGEVGGLITNGEGSNNQRQIVNGTTGETGGGLAHNNMPPYVALTYIIKY